MSPLSHWFVPVNVPSLSQIELFKNYPYSIGSCTKKWWGSNSGDLASVDTNNMQIHLFDPLTGTITLTEKGPGSKGNEMEPHHQMECSFIPRKPHFLGVLHFCRGYSQHIRSSADKIAKTSQRLNFQNEARSKSSYSKNQKQRLKISQKKNVVYDVTVTDTHSGIRQGIKCKQTNTTT